MHDEAFSSPGSHPGDKPKKTVNRRAAIVAGVSAVAASLTLGVQTSFAASVSRALLPSASVIRGKWAVQAESSGVSVLRVLFGFGNSVDGSVFNLNSRGRGWAGPPNSKKAFRIQAVRLLLSSQNVSHFSRDAGTFNLFGFDGRRSAGDVLFVPNVDFAGRLRANRISLSDRELLELSLTGATLQDVELISAAFPDTDIPTIALLSMSSLNAQSAVALKELLPTMTARDLKGFLASSITPSYVLDLRQSGLQHLTPKDIRNLKITHIDGAFVRSQTLNGIVPSVPGLLQAKEQSGIQKAPK